MDGARAKAQAAELYQAIPVLSTCRDTWIVLDVLDSALDPRNNRSVVVPIKSPPPEEPAAAAPEPMSAQDAEGWALLDGLRRRMDDQAQQNRTTNTKVSQLAESIGALVDIQRRRTRRLNLNSFVAYVIFTLLCGAGAYALYWSRAHELVASSERAEADAAAATKRADEATRTLAARDAADTLAADAWDLLGKGDRAGAAPKLAALANAPLGKVERAALDARAADARTQGGALALKAAEAAFKAGHFGDVAGPLEAALADEPSGPRAAAMHYYVGVVASKAGDLDKAILQLQAAISGDVAEDDVRFQLASALDRKGEYAKARGEYDRFVQAHPQAQLAAYALRRSATLARMPASVVLPPPKAVAPPKAPAAPAKAAPPRIVPKAAPVPPPAAPAVPVPTPVAPAGDPPPVE
jgi:tetratricopeptide (TPR) repeat protein